ncbi:non-ribosomal peptide synthetase [Nocardia tengchongensis]|uniref:non-ribosomal peptide synthetase n=1 Tax=Nocardia tengchongensis TaxID=2055889 RepID=UPI0036B29A21
MISSSERDSPMRASQPTTKTRRRPGSARLWQLLTRSVEHAPDAVAIRYNPTGAPADQRELTYRELDRRSSQLARELILRGAEPGGLVAAAIPRSLDSVVTLWAIAKSGAAYLPIDPAHPAERIRFLLEDSGVTLGVTTAEHRPAPNAPVSWLVLDDPSDVAEIDRHPSHPMSYLDHRRQLSADHPAYVIYTSGSTGTPKGVVVPHSGLVAMAALGRDYAVTADSRVLHLINPSFDFAMEELLFAFTAGATLVIAPATVRGGMDLADLLGRERITHLLTTPGVLGTVDPTGLDDLRVVVTGADSLGREVLARWSLPGRAMFHSYGPTEATVVVTSGRVHADEPITIGSIISGMAGFVLDQGLRLVPDDVIGELYLSGSGLAQGYLDRPGLTAQRFVAHPFEPGQRLYRTGDLVRRTNTGTLEFLGRSDFQVKIRGFRIELGEIDAALASAPDVDFAATLGHTLPSGATALVSYLLASPSGTIDTELVLEHARRALPEHMVPAAIVVLDSLPLTTNGKLDRSALPAPMITATQGRAPEGPVETRLAELFAEILGLDRVGADDSFFSIGGDSILSIQLVARARASTIGITVQEVFEHRTVAKLATIARLEEPDAGLAELPGGGVGPVSPTPILAAQLNQGIYRFSQHTVLALPTGISRAALLETLGAVLAHHDMLRAEVSGDAGNMAVRVPAAHEIDIAGLLSETVITAGTDTAAAASDALARALDALEPRRGRMVAFEWLRGTDTGDHLIIAVHHYAIDAVSWRILISDLMDAWAQHTAGRRPRLAPVGTSFRRWAHGLADTATHSDRVAELDHWQQVLATPDPPVGSHPIDPGKDTTATARRFTVELAPSLTEPLFTALPARYRATPQDALLAALAVAVRRGRNRRGDDVPVTRIRLEGHGREQDALPGADLSRTVGWFTTVYPVSIDLSGLDTMSKNPESAAALIKSVKEQLLAIPGKGLGFGMLRHLNPDTADLLSGDIAQIGFNFLGRVSAATLVGGDAPWLPTDVFGELPTEQDPAMPLEVAIDVNAIVTDSDAGPRLGVTIQYASRIVTEAQVRELAGDWVAALTEITEHLTDPDAGGLTPSDVPLVQVVQTELDRWRHRYPGLADVLPLSPLQEGLLFHMQLTAGSLDTYVTRFALELSGEIDAARLRNAADAVLHRHANLRTAFVTTTDGTPVQLVIDDVQADWDVAEDVPDERLGELLDAEQARRFDPAVAPMVRFTLYRTRSERTLLVLTTHHILFDGWSSPLLIKDLLTLYATFGDDTALGRVRPYRTYLEWLARQDKQLSRRIWRDTLAGAEPALLTAILPRRADAHTESATHTLELTREQTSAVTAFAAENGVTVNTVVQAAWGLLLAAALDRTEIVFGAVVSGRPPQLDGVEEIVGLFVNTIPVRLRIDAADTLQELLTRLQSEQAALLEHHYLGLGEIQAAAGGGDLFDTLLTFESYPIDVDGLRQAGAALDGMAVAGVQAVTDSHYPVSVVVELEAELRLMFSHRLDTLDAGSGRAYAERLRRIIDTIVAAPETPALSIPLLGPDEHHRFTHIDGGPATAVGALLPGLLGRGMAHGGDRVAVRFDGRSHTYKELDTASSQLARMLIARGLGPEDVVALAMPRCYDMVVAVWAVAKTGAAFVPVDPANPPDRLRHILTDSGAKTGITHTGLLTQLPDVVPWLCLDHAGVLVERAQYTTYPVTNIHRTAPLRAGNLAYVIYTSGSTGIPKGVTVTHAGLGVLTEHAVALLGLSPHHRFLHICTPSFDQSIEEWLYTFAAGATLVIAPAEIVGGAELRELLAAERVTHTMITPAMLGTVDPDGLDDLEVVATGGDAATGDLLARWQPGRRYINSYGPTETTITTTFAELTAGGPITLGGPISGTAAYVLDSRLRPRPAGLPGELYLAGPALARGYRSRAAQTSDRFVANPWGPPGARMYRTGDLVRWLPEPSGDPNQFTLEYLGRTDFQVKVRGFRIELGEIDAALTAHPSVEFAVTVGRQTPTGATSLVSYVLPVAGQHTDPATLTAHVKNLVPAHMVPALIMTIDEIPLTTTGKLDRNALPAPQFQSLAYRAPRTPQEVAITDVLAEILDVDRVGLDDDFFALGGNSLLATRVVARLNEALDTVLTVRDLLEAGTATALADRVASASALVRVPLQAVDRPGRIPLSLAQQRMWVLNQLDLESAHYNMPLALRITGRLDIAALRAAVTDVLERHESLRTQYPTGGPGALPYQEIVPVDQAFPTGVPVHTGEDVTTLITELCTTGFDVSRQVPVRVALLADGEEHIFIVVAHHIAADGISMGPLSRDLVSAYVARAGGQAPQWSPLPVQYADYALWQRSVLGDPADPGSRAAAQLRFWQTTLHGAPELLALPADRPRSAHPSLRGASLGFELPSHLHAALEEIAGRHRATLFMVVHAALAAVLARLTASTDVVVGTAVAGRGERMLDDQVGMFVNTLPLRSQVTPDLSFDELLTRTRDADMDAFANAEVPFESIVEAVAPTRSTAYNPLFQVALSFENTEDVTLRLPDLTVGVLDIGEAPAKFDLTVLVQPEHDTDGSAGPMRVTFTYATDLFDAVTVRTFGREFERLVHAVVTNPAQRLGTHGWADDDQPARTESPRTDAEAHTSLTPTLPDLMDAAVEANPDGIAIVYADADATLREVDYTDFDERSTQLARWLISRGVGPETTVAVGIPRSVESVLAVWAIAKAGAAFVPVDPKYPADRIAYMLTDSRAALGLTVAAARAALPESGEWLVLDDPATLNLLAAQAVEPIADADRVRPLRPDHPAYLIYTSGSTGLPKGVVVTHSGIFNYHSEQLQRYYATTSPRVLAFASPSFDMSMSEMLTALGGAGTLVVAAPTVYGGDELASLLRRERVTHVVMTPSALMSVDPTGLDRLRVVVTAGEACPPELVRRWVTPIAGRRMRRFINGYGPTETTVATHFIELSPDEPVILGDPVGGVTDRVLDSGLARVPAAVAGELYIAGAQVVRGYAGRPGLTATRFVADPYGPPGSRMYRTGDMVRRIAGGGLHYLGRNDFQVKVRGFRIELSEIDAVLEGDDSVDFAVTIGHDLDTGATILAAYVHAAPGAVIDVAAVSGLAERSLPPHMVPGLITVLDEIPLTPVGKLDRAALPTPVLRATEFRSPSGPTQVLLAGVFAELLGVDRPIGADDDFFALGGNSLIATQLAARVGALIGARVPARMVLEDPVLSALATRLDALEDRDERVAVTSMPRPDRVPLSPAQQRMWFRNQFDTASPADNVPFALRLTGELDTAALQSAIGDVIDRHEILRTRYPATDGIGYQQVLPAADVTPDLRPMPMTADQIPAWLEEFVTAGFDVTTSVPLRATLIRLTPTEHVVALVVHHIAADGSSIAPFARDLLTAYLARTGGEAPAWEPLPVQYADYTLWQLAQLGAESDPASLAGRQLAFWRDTLAQLPVSLDLPFDRPRPPVASGRGAQYQFTLSAGLHDRLVALAAQSKTTTFMVIHAGFAALLARLSGTSDIALGTPVAGRGERELDDLIGMFVNTLVLRTGVDPAASFVTLLDAVKAIDLDAFAHAELPFEQLVAALDPARSSAHHPLIQVALFFQNINTGRLELPGLGVEELETDGITTTFDLELHLVPPTATASADMAATFIYSTDLFDPATIAAFAARFIALLEAVVTDPLRPLGDIDLLTDTEARRILVEWNDTHRPAPTGLLLDRYRHTVATHPDALAVIDDREQLSYQEFDARVNRLARRLIAADVGPESLVALAIRRSVDLVVGIYAVLTAGGAYVPVDPDHPSERIGHVLDTAAPVCVLTTRDVTAAWPPAVPVLFVDDHGTGEMSGQPLRPGETTGSVRPEHPAYVIFTSGSTGRPKGVVVSHAAIDNQIRWMLAEYPLGPDDVYLQKTAATFDVSLWGYFLPLSAGARLVLADHHGHRDPRYLARLIQEHSVTVTDFVPSMLAMFAAELTPGSLPSLREVFVIGEALPPATVTALGTVSPARVHNLYGPTEAAVSVTYWHARPRDIVSVPIGAPQWNTRVYVLDSRLRPVPAGVAGELYLAGDQLARGYATRPDLTADRFVANPFEPGRRMYRTGDSVVWRAGTGQLPARLDYLGRTDFQVKLRGQRIELGEIEAALTACAAITQAAVIVYEAPQHGSVLAAYVVTTDSEPDFDEVHSELAARLPGYMIPGAFTVLDALPLNASGKTDRKALPAPTFRKRAFRAPGTPAEYAVTAVFADVLGVAEVGLDDDFFALGGNSLTATRLASRLSDTLDQRVPVATVFTANTPAAILAALADTTAAGEDEIRRPLRASARPDRIPLSPPQRRMWFLNQFDTSSTAYSLPVAVKLTGALDSPALAAAITDLLGRHEILRTIYPQTADGPEQLVLPLDADLPGLEIHTVARPALEAAVADVLSTTFDVSTQVPLRVALLRVKDTDDHVLAMVIHHIAADGSSLSPLTRDLMTAYTLRAAGQAPAWAPLPIQYADYALWHHQMLGTEDDPGSPAAHQIAYWRAALAELPDHLELPADRQRPAAQSFAGGAVEVHIDAETHHALRELAHTHQATLFMVVQTAVAVLLARLSGTADIPIGTPVAGRADTALDDLIGMFVNTLVMRTRVDSGDSFETHLVRQREVALSAFAHADVPFERLVDVLAPERTAARHPLFQVGLSFQNLAPVSFELPGLTVTALDVDLGISQFDLHWILSDAYDETGRPLGLSGHITYAADLFDEHTAAEIGDRFTRLLAALTTDAARPVGDLDLLRSDEHQRLRDSWATEHEIPTATTLPGILATAVARYPDAPAVIDWDGTRIGYAQLGRRVNRLARQLIAAGVGPESVVALGIHRSIDLITAMCAVTVAGGAYLPLDPAQPEDRLRMVLDTAAPRLLLTAGDVEVPATSTPRLHIDRTVSNLYRADPITDAERVRPLRPDNTAYVIFTSGSTGRPKGVAVTHAAIVNQLAWKAAEFDLTNADRVLVKTAATFDLSVWEYLSLLTVGGTLVLAAPGDQRDPARLHTLMECERVTTLHTVPSMLDALLAATGPTLPASLRRVLAIGEELSPALARRFREGNPGVALVNLYGPTEAAVSITAHPVTEDYAVSVPIGLPQWNSHVHVLDARLHPVPPGVPGELYLSGSQLARGYLARPGLTADRFVASPFEPGARMYRTGDLVAWNRGGTLEYRGRTDFQVKIRGFRIEPGEIEAALLALPGVARAAVIATPGGDRLAAYVVPLEDTVLDSAQLRTALSDMLPSYLIPAAFVLLDALPVNSNGKLDRTALPAPQVPVVAYRPPATATEQTLATVFAELLGLGQVGLDDDFFAAGGDSIRSIQLVSAARERGVILTAGAVFEHRTVGALARAADLAEPSTDTPQDVPFAAEGELERWRQTYPGVSDVLPLTPSQAGIRYLMDLTPHSVDDYMIQLNVELAGDVDDERLRRAAQAVLHRHPSLRTAFIGDAGGHPVQLVVEDLEIPWQVMTGVTDTDIPGLLDADRGRRFDPVIAPLLRITLYRTVSGRTVLALTTHHIAVDGWSIPLLMRDLLVYYATDTDPAALPPAPSLREYARWLAGRDLVSDEAIWRKALIGAEPTLAAAALPRPEHVTESGFARQGFVLPQARTAALNTYAAQRRVTVNTVIQVAWALVLAAVTDRQEVVFGAAVSGRPPQVAGIHEMAGMFVNTVPVRIHFDHRSTVTELLERVQHEQGLLIDYHHVGMAAVLRATAGGELFDTIVAFESYPVDTRSLREAAGTIDGVSIAAVDTVSSSHYPVSVVVQARDELQVDLHCRRDVVAEWSAQALTDQLRRVLDQLLADPDANIADLSPLSAEDRHNWTHRSDKSADTEALLPDLLTRGGRSGLERIAIRSQAGDLTYGELDAVSSQLARVLIDRGVEPETRVIVALPRSAELVATVLAIAKAGGAHVPVDPGYPRDRIRHMITDSGAALGITTTKWLGALPGDIEWLRLDNAALRTDRALRAPTPITDADRIAVLRPDHAAYLIYTSGSTGTPKGVVVTHRGLGALVQDFGDRTSVGPRHRVLHLCSPSFDPSILEWLSALTHGARLVIAPPEVIGGAELHALMRTERITHAMMTPGVLSTMNPAGLDHLEFLITGGDVITSELIDAWQPGRSHLNAYGPTEATITATTHSLQSGARTMIGTPLAGTTTLVLDSRLRPVPPGVTGELYLAGPGLARGYRNQPALTAERFIANPWGDAGTRLYRTGDLARWLPEGDGSGWQLEFRGRRDHQVKIRGHRIELGEIDAVLGELPDVGFAITSTWVNRSGATVLVAYVVPTPGASVRPQQIIEHAAARLPATMIPAAVVPIDTIPLTAVGKLDRAALPEPELTERRYRAPESLLEKAVCDAFAEVLGVDRIGLDDDFFECGGTSLTAAVLTNRLGGPASRPIPVAWILTAPTPARLIARLSAHESDTGLEVLLPLREITESAVPPLFCVHPLGGLSWSFSGLARHLGERPLYGLQSPALSGADMPESIEEWADLYIDAIRSVQPAGPYHLLGWSLGGLLSHTIAVRLHAQGERIALLAMMDSYLHTDLDGTLPTEPESLAEILGGLAGAGDADLRVDDLSTVDDLLAHAGRLPEPFAAMSPDELRAIIEAALHSIVLAVNHRAEAYAGDLLYFAATDGTDHPGGASTWTEAVAGHIDIHPIPATHWQMTSPAALEAIAAVIEQRLAHPTPATVGSGSRHRLRGTSKVVLRHTGGNGVVERNTASSLRESAPNGAD